MIIMNHSLPEAPKEVEMVKKKRKKKKKKKDKLHIIYLRGWVLQLVLLGQNLILNSDTTHIQSTLVISNSKDSLKHLEISVPRNIRVAEVRKTINRTTNLTNEYVI